MLGDAVDKDKTSGGDIIKSITDTDPRDGDKRKLGPSPETISIGQGIRLIKMSSLLLQVWSLLHHRIILALWTQWFVSCGLIDW